MTIEHMLALLNEGETYRVKYKPFIDLGPLSKRSFVGDYVSYNSKSKKLVFDRPILDLAIIGIHLNWPIKTKDIISIEELKTNNIYAPQT